MNSDRFLSMLGLCMRAGRLSVGHDAAKQSIRDKKAFLCIMTADASARLVEEMKTLCASSPLIVTDYGMEDIKTAIGKKAGVMSVNDEGFANTLRELRNKEGSAYGN
ncbi:MAG: ribosomal L7Ae/L30e/S12e/Gadd45 family protein [Oscillospiraceae bacterium]|jgi:ribosomal protein L7Ae-like RNA K-turn-binding protein|nr:ribosomal L7Ae/L30e/S12e/Gadd45 family protein [Oscillospiraceae bacterium]